MKITVEIPDGSTCLECVFLYHFFDCPICSYHKPDTGSYMYLKKVYNDNTGAVEWYNAEKCQACLEMWLSSKSVYSLSEGAPGVGLSDRSSQ